jgi:hypothetical protein
MGIFFPADPEIFQTAWVWRAPEPGRRHRNLAHGSCSLRYSINILPLLDIPVPISINFSNESPFENHAEVNGQAAQFRFQSLADDKAFSFISLNFLNSISPGRKISATPSAGRLSFSYGHIRPHSS